MKQAKKLAALSAEEGMKKKAWREILVMAVLV
jgi:hypothetical protein